MIQPKFKLLFWLLLLDALFIVAYLASIKLAPLSGSEPTWYGNRFSPAIDGSFPELYQYVKWVSAACMFVLMARARQRWHELSWALAFTYFFVDDAFQVHERLGDWIGLWFQDIAITGLRPEDLGELTVSGGAAGLLAVAILLACKTGTPEFRKMSLDLVLLVGALAVVGVVADMLNIYLGLTLDNWKLGVIMDIVEDGGEMAVASLFVGFIYWMYSNPPGANNRLRQYLKWS